MNNNILYAVLVATVIFVILLRAADRAPEPKPEMCSCAGKPDCSTHVFAEDLDQGLVQVNCAFWSGGGYCCKRVQ